MTRGLPRTHLGLARHELLEQVGFGDTVSVKCDLQQTLSCPRHSLKGLASEWAPVRLRNHIVVRSWTPACIPSLCIPAS